MLDQLFSRPAVLARLQTGALGSVLDDFVDDMRARGHALATMRQYVRDVDHFAAWMHRRRCTPGMLDEATVEAFLSSLRAAARDVTQMRARAALRRLLWTLRNKGLVPAPVSSPPSAAETWVAPFVQYSAESRGLAAATCRQQGRYVREFLNWRFGSGPIEIEKVSGRNLADFIVSCTDDGRRLPAKIAATALRAFLRFQTQQGACAAELLDAVPTVARRDARPPRYLRPKQLAALLASFDRAAPIGRRDYAITVTLARMGLRIGEVLRLRLEDIQWREGVLHIQAGKCRRPSTLPLLREVGAALAQYIRGGRPRTTERQVFVTHVAPLGRPLGVTGAIGALKSAFRRAGLQGAPQGTHVLRHTLATNMLCAGASLKEIADVLRHRSLDMTAVYARVDLPALRSVAMPWPEVR